ncbi:hypothetical protein ABT112_17640 [Streptomyces sp. NPDC002055]|uniref:hypothetical protein n=1 Tax=Streptomyces sp. NPDC002055 TaxID=3154534 RepID=UPI0033166EA5
MGNVFDGGDGRSLYLSNGGTEVFVDVLMLAVSDLAATPWHFRFASLVTLQDQNMMGRGTVGFSLEDIDWSPSPEQAREFVLRAIDLALTGHRRDELGYDPPHVDHYLRDFRDLVAAFRAPDEPRDQGEFPGPEEALVASCVRHRLLSGLPHWDGCLLCVRP